jgi:hypothetical protein
MIFSTVAQLLTDSDNHCQQSAILRHTSVLRRCQMHHDHTIETFHPEVFFLHATPLQIIKSTTDLSFHLAG